MNRRAASLCLALLAGCDRDEAPAPAPSASVAVAAKSASAEPAAPWYAGTWKATFETEPHRVDLDKKHGAPPAWTDDEPNGDGVGQVELSVVIDDEGNAAGAASGALGKLEVRGHLEEETLKLSLIPRTSEDFRGTLVASKKDDTLRGELKASRGDSLTLSKAAVTLDKSPDD